MMETTGRFQRAPQRAVGGSGRRDGAWLHGAARHRRRAARDHRAAAAAQGLRAVALRRRAPGSGSLRGLSLTMIH